MPTATQPGDPMTDAQRRIYEFIRAEKRGRGQCPTVREIQREFGITSPNGVMCHIRGLVAKGYLTPASKRSRAWTVVGDEAPGDEIARLREAIRSVLDRLAPIPPEDPGGDVCYGGYFSRSEVDHYEAMLGEGG